MLDKGMLEVVMTDVASTGKPVWIVYPQRKHLSARVQAFIEWVRELFDRTNQCPVAAARAMAEPMREETLAEVA
jgi:LysR family transcriptional regulator for bpeEF and oprC